MARLVACLFSIFCLVLPAAAQQDDRPDTILVLDASGSMWGQIDGINKIVIAREVIADVLSELPADLDLGLMAYGHNRRGDCSDIEMLIEPGPDTRGAIVDAVNSINPRGRTPMSDAVVAAAQALRYTENAATVILVSDGIETCEADPCAIGAELEASGVGFTAHVIGFDVASEPEARAQMHCLAENTGGEFLTADTADELAAALTQVTVAPPAPPVSVVTITAAVEPDMTPPASPLIWTLSNGEGEVLLGPVPAPGFNVELQAGDYRIEVLRETQGTTHAAEFTVVSGEPQTVTVPLPALLIPVTFEARLDSVDGPLITDPVIWAISGADSETQGNPLGAELTAGSYDVEAYWTAAEQTQQTQIAILGPDPRTVVVVFDTPLPSASLLAPESAVAGSTIEVAWEGPDLQNDFVSVAGPDDETGYINYTYTRDGSPLDLLMPAEPGTYEIRYVASQDRTTLAARQIEVTPASATLTAPETAAAGSTIEVAWDGPDYQNDFISVASPDDETGYVNYTYTRDGSPLDLLMPSEPGVYEIRYVMNQDRTVLAARQIEITTVAATLEAPETAAAGSTIEVAWDGPDYQNDFISVARPDDETGYVNYTYTRDGSPLDLLMPSEPGTYEIRYVANQDRTVLAARQIEITTVGATLEAPETAAAGSTIEVAWDGPDYQNDFISVARPDDETGYVNYTYTRDGSPLDLLMPSEPGTYEIRYVANQDRTVLAARQIEITTVGATLEAPETVAAGSTIEVAWDGPDYQNDFISVARPDDDTGYVNYTYTRDGSPLDLLMPSEPGTYEIRYVANQDRTILAARQIEITTVGATLEAPETTAAGSTIEVAWDGPDYQNDFISVARPDDDTGYVNYTYTRDGSPLDLLMPSEPGTYEIRYVANQDRTVLAVRQIEVTTVTASLVAPDSAPAGSTIEVAWDGPDYQNDFISVARSDDRTGYENYTYTRQGAPLELLLPPQPGTYEIRYVANQDRTILAARQIEVTAVTASITAPETAVAGSTVEVSWEGPDYANDFISVARPGDDTGYVSYTYTRNGTKLAMEMPEEPGSYEIRYVVNQDRVILASVVITVTAP
ncbi:VWA domain-containing protein [Rhodobacterales bacterium HKCCE3408]|nr:VWA domain-containing protein [Rhodobacterales bacterium HKCCE3408]